MFLRKSSLLLSASVAAATNFGLLASSTATAAEPMLEEIIVTAQKREQNLQDTVISITAFNTVTMDRLNVTNLEDVSHFTPNLRITSVASDASTSSIAMRGTFNRNPTDPNSENTVGVYMDGVYIGKSAGGLMELGDLQRVEVLRGPQGTLYGKNTVGGAINMIRQRPGDEFSAKLRAGAGNEGLFYSKGGIDLPGIGTVDSGLGQVRSRVSFLTRTRDGLVDNVPSTVESPVPSNPIDGASEFGDIDHWAVGVSLDWEINDAVLLSYDYDRSKIDQNGVYTQLTYAGPGNFGFLEPWAESDRNNNGSLDYKDSFDKAKIFGHALTANWRVGDFGALGEITIKSITAYRDVDSSSGYDLDGTNVSVLHFTRENDYNQFSQELQFIGSTDTLKYVVGLYYFNEEADYDSYRHVFADLFGSPDGGGRTKFDNDTKAVFGQVEWQPAALERLTLTLGGRYSEEDKETHREVISGDVPIIPYQKLPDLDFDEDTYLASVAWALTDNANVYAKVSDGYRSGSYDGQSRDPAIFDIPTDPEQLTAYEVGFKSRWLEDRLQVNTAVFYSDYEDMLISSWDPDTSTTRTQNAGEGKITGVELEALAQVTESLLLSFSYGYLDGDWDNYPGVDAAGNSVELKNIAEFPQTPENNYAVGLDYNIPFFNIGQMNFHIDYSYTDDLYIVPLSADGLTAPIKQARIESREMTNARLEVTDIAVGGSSTLEFAVWGKNLTDEDVERSKFDGGNAVFSEWDDPITYGADITLRF